MFWNLVRYEFKNVNKWYLALRCCACTISVDWAFDSSLSQSYVLTMLLISSSF